MLQGSVSGHGPVIMQNHVFLQPDFYINIFICCALIYAAIGDIFFTSFINIHIICIGKKTEKKRGFIVIIKLYNCTGLGLSRCTFIPTSLTSKLLMVGHIGANPWRESKIEREREREHTNSTQSGLF